MEWLVAKTESFEVMAEKRNTAGRYTLRANGKVIGSGVSDAENLRKARRWLYRHAKGQKITVPVYE